MCFVCDSEQYFLISVNFGNPVIFLLLFLGKTMKPQILFFFHLVFSIARGNSSCVAFSVFHEYFTSNLSAFSAVISCVNLYPQFSGLTRQALTKESNLNVV